jgi:hypothetical protein
MRAAKVSMGMVVLIFFSFWISSPGASLPAVQRRVMKDGRGMAKSTCVSSELMGRSRRRTGGVAKPTQMMRPLRFGGFAEARVMAATEE